MGPAMTQFPQRLKELAAKTKGFMPEAEGEALFQHALAITDEVSGPIIEIGSYCGLSALYLGEAARILPRQFVTIDHHRGSEEMLPPSEYFDPDLIDPISGRFDSLSTLRRTLELAELEEYVTVIVGESTRIAGLVKDPISALFIDGGHGSLATWNDFSYWSEKIDHGGLLMIHDVFADPNDGGRPPFEIYTYAMHLGDFTEIAQVGSLRVLQRTPRP